MMPVMYDNCWHYGALAMGTEGKFEYTLGANFGAPSAPLNETDTNENFAFHSKVGYAVTPGLKMYLSAAMGAYLSRDVIPYLPQGASINEYMQNLFVFSVDWKWNYLWFMGEAFLNHYETPLRADGLSNTSFYVQGVYSFLPGWDYAVRFEEIRYEEVEGSAGTMTWDQNVLRVETGVTYHVTRELLLKGVVQATELGDGWKSDNVQPAVQLSFAF